MNRIKLKMTVTVDIKYGGSKALAVSKVKSAIREAFPIEGSGFQISNRAGQSSDYSYFAKRPVVTS